jgi:hypothetical protein
VNDAATTDGVVDLNYISKLRRVCLDMRGCRSDICRVQAVLGHRNTQNGSPEDPRSGDLDTGSEDIQSLNYLHQASNSVTV